VLFLGLVMKFSALSENTDVQEELDLSLVGWTLTAIVGTTTMLTLASMLEPFCKRGTRREHGTPRARAVSPSSPAAVLRRPSAPRAAGALVVGQQNYRRKVQLVEEDDGAAAEGDDEHERMPLSPMDVPDSTGRTPRSVRGSWGGLWR
jgi:hypothetical protein